MSSNYEGVLTIPVSIPASVIESMGVPDTDAVEDYNAMVEHVLASAEFQLHDLIGLFQEALRG